MYDDGTGSDWGYSDSATEPLPGDEVRVDSPAITPTVISDSEIDLSWQTVDGGNLIVAMDGVPGAGGQGGSHAVYTGNITQSDGYSHLPVTGLTAGTHYFFSVQINAQIFPSGSFQVSYGSTDATTTGAAEPNNGPYGLTATYEPGLGGVQLEWMDESNNESGFDVQRSVDDVNFTTIEHTDADINSYLNTTTGPDSVYYYRVCATGGTDDSVKSGYTNTATVNTPGVSIVVQSDQTDPAGNPEIWLNDEDANDNGTPDYQENGPISGETDLVPVQINVPLGADDYGTATLSWNVGIKLWSDANKTTMLGGGFKGDVAIYHRRRISLACHDRGVSRRGSTA